MSKVFPQPVDLPIGSQPFAREVISRIEADEAALQFTKSDLQASMKGLGATVQNVSEQLVLQQETIADLTSRYAVIDNGDFLIDTGNIPNDATFRDYGSEMVLQIVSPGPQKQLIVTFGAGGVEIWSVAADSSVLGEITIAIDGVVAYNSYVSRVQGSRDLYYTVPAINSRSFSLAAGTYTVRAKCRARVSGSSGTCWVKFHQPYLQAQIVGA